MTQINCRYGEFLAFEDDSVISRSLLRYGEWAQHEISILSGFATEHSVVIDVGANIGTHAVALARCGENLHVVAIEAQPFCYSLLSVNCARNARDNIYPYNLMCGASLGAVEVEIDYRVSDNMGAISFAAATGVNLGALDKFSRKQRSFGSQFLITVPLDFLRLDLPVSLVKIDVEGMEFEVLRGADELIRQDHPTLYIEQLDTAHLQAIADYLRSLDFNLYWLETHPFNKMNFRREEENLWWRTEMGILAVHCKKDHGLSLPVVTGTEQFVPFRLDARIGWGGV